LIKFYFRHNNSPYSKELQKLTQFQSPTPSLLKEVDTIVLEDMVGATSEAIEKVTQMLDKQGEIPAQLGNRLGCLEEGRRKKPKQDKEDEFNHEKDGKIDKIAIETTMMMEKMQKAFRKAQGMDDFLYTIGGLGLTPLAPLPPKFKISDAENF